jgi:hypothetical protein
MGIRGSDTLSWWGNVFERPFGRPKWRWENNMKMDLREIGYEDSRWIKLAHDSGQWLALVLASVSGTRELVSFIFRVY